jgi:antitoxin component YwqK of YwqJK toxin-antitoxin module
MHPSEAPNSAHAADGAARRAAAGRHAARDQVPWSGAALRSCTMSKLHDHPVDGPQKEYFAGGELSAEGRFRNGKRHGKWKFYYRNGRPKAVGKYVDGELDGNWQWWRESGQPLQKGAFKNGKQVGPWKRYFDNGQLWDQGTYDDGKKVGEWKVFDKAGALKQRKVFKAKK